MKCYAKKVIEVAKAEVGYLEKASNASLDSKTGNAGKKNYTKYARDLDAISGFYNGKKQGFAWCDVFVDWCFVQAYGAEEAKRLLCQPAKSLGAGCGYSMKYYASKGQLHTKPEAGDQIFFKNSDGGADHTGLVYKVDKTYVYTVEGNTSSGDGVIANGGSVQLKKYKLGTASLAYGRPEYDGYEEPEEPKLAYKVGDEVNFTGKTHYTNANAAKGSACKPGKAKVTEIYSGGKHPYHLIRTEDGGSTVWGWVNAADISATQSVASEATKKDYQCIYTVVKGDSLWAIARRFLGSGVKYTEIMAANSKKTPTIYVGEKIKIPNK